MTEHVGITASRQEPTPKQVNRLMGVLAADLACDAIVHHGDCVGGDRCAHYLSHAIGLRVIIHPPLSDRWRAYCAYAFEERLPEEYLRRDRRIVQETHRLIALPYQTREVPRGSGTWYTVRYARKAGVPVTIIWPNGVIHEEVNERDKTPSR